MLYTPLPTSFKMFYNNSPGPIWGGADNFPPGGRWMWENECLLLFTSHTIFGWRRRGGDVKGSDTLIDWNVKAQRIPWMLRKCVRSTIFFSHDFPFPQPILHCEDTFCAAQNFPTNTHKRVFSVYSRENIYTYIFFLAHIFKPRAAIVFRGYARLWEPPHEQGITRQVICVRSLCSHTRIYCTSHRARINEKTPFCQHSLYIWVHFSWDTRCIYFLANVYINHMLPLYHVITLSTNPPRIIC